MPKRQYCPKCHYPQSVCLCDAVKPVGNQTHIVVLQHPSENRESKNTVRLMSLALQHCEVVVGETEADFAQIKQRCAKNSSEYALLYPNENSHPIESVKLSSTPVKHLLLLDGTWKKAYKIWQLNPWLHEMTSCHFNSPPASIYQRKTRQKHSVSTLEACAYALEQLEKKDYQSMTKLLAVRQARGF